MIWLNFEITSLIFSLENDFGELIDLTKIDFFISCLRDQKENADINNINVLLRCTEGHKLK